MPIEGVLSHVKRFIVGDPIPSDLAYHERFSRVTGLAVLSSDALSSVAYASFHLKDRTTPANGQRNVPWGTGDTPLVQILQTVQKNRWKMPATIEVEYDVPAGSDAVREVVKCREFCKRALA
jgi:L-ribulose-5-phosphate 3-epimerase UlaE